jgi:hypothetical protein
LADLPQNDHFDLEVVADGYARRQGLVVQRTIDGRYRFGQKNVIQMERPARIEGCAIGPDGNPFANQTLQLFSNNGYSPNRTLREIMTDGEGRFAVDDLASGTCVLSYAKTRSVKKNGHWHREYDGLCGAVVIDLEAGQARDDIVLDLSASICELRIAMTDTEGQPVDEAVIYFNVRMPPGTSGYRFMTIFNAYQKAENGRFRFSGLPPGTWYIKSRHDTLGMSADHEVNLTKEKSTRLDVQFAKALQDKQ